MDVENMLKTNEGGPTLAQIERGTYLFLRNLFSKDARDADGTATIEASLHSERGEKSMGGRWQILDRDHIEVKKIRRRMEEQGLTINKDSTNLTVTPAYIPLTPLRQILAENPQLPTRYKFEAIVVDHLPTKLEYFSRVMCDYCGCSYKDGMCSKCGNSDTGRVRWMFSLLLGDGADSFMPVVVSEDDADQFLKFEAKDMKSDQECLQRLRTALSGLWSYRVDGVDDVRFKLIATELIW
ncbi:hypothetical protein HDU99_006014 [Rhizoclosmatium hyalinum]|nr:hypothetical protein HDU99_006014 [Rhizoclosmatium hyalinum]